LARGLGWFGIGLGLAEVAGARAVSRMVGIRDTAGNRLLVRALGAREIASGTGILAGSRPANWLWSRVGGDTMDLAVLLGAFARRHASRTRLASATAAMAGVAMLDVVSSRRLSRAASIGIRATESITVYSARERVYYLWRQLEKLPDVMSHLESVRDLGNGRSLWRAKAPAGLTVEWEAELTEDVENERIGWRALEGSTIPNAGSVTFLDAPGGRGTEIHVDLRYDPPAGPVGAAIAKLFGKEPSQEIAKDLRRFKQRLETGEVSTARGPSGKSALRLMENR
jgi:uncharacterized membrane protein